MIIQYEINFNSMGMIQFITTASLGEMKKIVEELKKSENVTDIDVYEVQDGDTTTAYFDIDNFKRIEMDG